MERYWLGNDAVEDAPLENLWGTQPLAGGFQPGGMEIGAPFRTQVEQILGAETEPDSEFFIDSWTVGVAAASENLLRRQMKTRRDETPAWSTFPSFAPSFFAPPNFASSVGRAEASVEFAWPLRAAEASTAYRQWRGYEESGDRQAADEIEMGPTETDQHEMDELEMAQLDMAGPLTPESACRVLGVAGTSTREQIRAAYRKMASRYHPDRLVRSGPRELKLASDRMAAVNEAYRVLCMGLAARC